MRANIAVSILLLIFSQSTSVNGQDIFNISSIANNTEDSDQFSSFQSSVGATLANQIGSQINMAEILDSSSSSFENSGNSQFEQFLASEESNTQQQQTTTEAETVQQNNQQQIDFSIEDIVDEGNNDENNSGSFQQQFEVFQDYPTSQTFQDTPQNNFLDLNLNTTDFNSIIQGEEVTGQDSSLNSNSSLTQDVSEGEQENFSSGEVRGGGRIINRLVETSIYGGQTLPGVTLMELQGRVDDIIGGVQGSQFNQGGVSGFPGGRRLLKEQDR